MHAALAVAGLLLAADPDPAGAQAWLTARFPELSEYAPVAQQERALAALLTWARLGTIYDRRCRPIPVERRGDALYAKVNVQRETRARTRVESADELLIGTDLVLTCGYTTTSRRDADGRWREVSTSATGCADQIGLGLGRVTPDAVWYDSRPAVLRIGCVEREQSCAGTCQRCLRYGVIASGHGPGYGLATQVMVRTATTADCKSPCPPEPEPEDVTRANGLLAGQRYLMEGLDEHPLFFKSKKACRTYRRRHLIPQDDLTLW